MRGAAPLAILGGGALGLMLFGDRRDAAAAAVPRVLAPPSGTWVWPVPAWRGRKPVVSDGWGSNRDGGKRKHRGVDIMFKRARRDELIAEFPPGTPDGSKWFFMPQGIVAVAAADGRVRSAGWAPRGNAVVIRHEGWATFYAHLASLLIRDGEHVKAGQPLGLIGADPLDRQGLRHLHFALWHGGNSDGAIDPEATMRRWKVVEVAGV
jgi:murein DD-endopeptidase MepM/ murein hydrolase activator NlpD